MSVLHTKYVNTVLNYFHYVGGCDPDMLQIDLHALNLLKTKCRPLYLKTQFVPRCKHFSTWL
jgi:hypothetical protein